MRWTDALFMSVRAIGSNRLRALLTLVGIVAGVLAGMAMGLIMAVLTVTLRTDQVFASVTLVPSSLMETDSRL